MKFLALCLLACSFGASAQTYVQPHFRSNGTLVDGHYRGGSTSSTYSGTGSSGSSTYVQPHVTHSGSFVQGYHRTTPDSSTLNNYGTSGNFNPYTGATGTRSSCKGFGC
jgi:hypothetical protein